MSESIRPSGAWWAPSTRHARRSTIWTAAIVLVLALITWTVWASPASNPVTVAAHALGVPTKADKLATKAASADKLQKQLEAAQQRIWKLEGQLQSANASGSSRADQIAKLQTQLKSAYSKLGTAKSGAAKAGSVTAAGAAGTAAGTSGSGSASASGNGGTSVDPQPAAAITAPSKSTIDNPTNRYFGLYTDQAPFNWATYDAISAKVGEAPNMVGYFQGFDQDFRADAVQRSWANGRLPMLTWESRPINAKNDSTSAPQYSLAKIANGDLDAYIKKYADSITATGLPLALRFDHEMNATWYPWNQDDGHGTAINGNSAGDYVKAWKHIHDVFAAEGANQFVTWVWSPTRVDRLTTGEQAAHPGDPLYSDHTSEAYLKTLYPGDDYVDWVGTSGYLRPPYDDRTVPTFDGVFGKTLTMLRDIAPGKKIILAETGASETGGYKASFFKDFFAALAKPANADIIGFAYFNLVATTYVDGELTTNDWRLDSRADSMAAFTEGLERTDIDYDLKEIEQ